LGSKLQINYKKESFSDQIRERFGDDSVDLIIDFVGSPYWEENIDCLAVDGRLIFLSMLGGAKVDEMDLVPILRKRLTVKGSTLRNRSQEYKRELTGEFWKRTESLFKDEELTPVISAIFDWEEVEKAHQMMKENRNAGKIVLTGM